MWKPVWFFVSCLLLLNGCAEEITQEQAFVYLLANDPASFDPHVASEPEVGIVSRQVYDTLVYRHPQTKEIVPGLATDWTVSEDGLTYTFRLRDGVVFHDSTRLDAVAVGVNLDRIISLGGHAASLLKNYRSYEVVDGRTIRIRLTEPFSPLLDVLSLPYFGIASPLALGEYSSLRYQFYQVGTGPFKFVDFVPGSHVILERAEGYGWRVEFYTGELEREVKRIEFRLQTNARVRVQQMERNAADVASQLIPTDARSLSVNTQVRVLPTALPGQPTQFLINTLNPPTDDRLVRLALLYGTNRNEIADVVFQGFSPVAYGPLSTATLFYSREMNNLYEYDIVQAGELLEAAGYTDSNDDGFVDAGGEPLSVTVLAQSETFAAEVAQLLQSQWQVIGVRVQIELQPTDAALIGAAQLGEYNLVADRSAGFDPYFLADYYASNGEKNWTGFQSETLDDLFATATRSADPVTRAGAYVQAQRLIMNEVLVLPIREIVNLNVASARVQNLQFDAYGWYPLLPNVQLGSVN